jgi:predicted nucleotidyltransferase
MDREAVIAALRAALAGAPVRLAILFGSVARGRTRADSDVDVAILPRDPDLQLREELKLQAQLERACRREIDLVRMDRADTLLAWQIARHGVVLKADPPAEYARFVMRAAADYLDAQPALEAAARRYARRLVGAT